MRNNHPLIEAVAAEPLLFDRSRADLFSSILAHLTTSPEAMKLLDAPSASSAMANDDFWSGGDDSYYRPYAVSDGVLQIPVQGALLNHFPFTFGRWATGYQYIERALARGLDDSNVKAIALVCNSPGGMVAGCFECADKIFYGRERKPIRAFAADYAYSAAYAIASAANDVVVSRSGGTGSVGVVTSHVDFSKALENEGVKITFVFAGDHKVDGNPYEALSAEVKARIQERVDRSYSVFTSTVARNRAMDEEKVRETKALTYDAEDSINVGFADRVGSLEQELVVFREEVTAAEDEQMSFTQEQMDAAVTAAGVSAKAAGIAEGHAKGLSEGLAQGATAERTRINAIMGSDAAKARPKAAMAMALKSKDSAEDVTSMLADLPEEKAQAQTPSGTGTPFDNAMGSTGNPEVGADGGAGGDQNASFTDGFFGSFGMKNTPARN